MQLFIMERYGEEAVTVHKKGGNMNKKGFTLIELLAIIVVLSMLTILVLPSLTGAVDNSKIDGTLSIASLATLKAKLYVSSNENFTIPDTAGQVKLLTFEELNVESTKTTFGADISASNSFVLVDSDSNYYVTITTAVGEKGIINVIDSKLTSDYNPVIIYESNNDYNRGLITVESLVVDTSELSLDTTGDGIPDTTALLIEKR